MNIVIFTGLANIDKNLVGTAVIYKKIAAIAQKLGYCVDIVVPDLAEVESGINCHSWDKKNNEKLINQCDIAVFGAYPPIEPLLYVSKKKKIIMSYLWSLSPIGSMEFSDYRDFKKQRKLNEFICSSYNLQLLLSDKIFCRDAEARKIILGSLLSLGRIDLYNYQEDKSLKKIAESAPFGIEKKSPRHMKNVYRGVVEGLGKNDFLLLSSGGIWNWNDGEVLISAMKLLSAKYHRNDIKLIFQGFRHPDSNQKLSDEAEKTLRLAEKSGLIGKNIFFAPWLPFTERDNYLCECDAGIVSSPDIPEANFFLKTRIYDYLWADLPVILGDNEAFSSLIKEKELGVIAKCGEADDWARVIIGLYRDKKKQNRIKSNIKNIKKEMIWDKTLGPVRKFLKNPEKDKNLLLRDRKLFFGNIEKNIEAAKS